MLETREGQAPKIKNRSQTYGQISIDWGGVIGNFTEEELLTASQPLTEGGVRCRILNVAVRPSISQAVGEDDAMMIALPGPAEHAEAVQNILGRYDWSGFQEEGRLAQLEQAMEAVAMHNGMKKYGSVDEAMSRAPPPVHGRPEGYLERIARETMINQEVQRRMEELLRDHPLIRAAEKGTTAGRQQRTAREATPATQPRTPGTHRGVVDLPDTMASTQDEPYQGTTGWPVSATFPADYRAADQDTNESGDPTAEDSDVTMGAREPEDEDTASAEFMEKLRRTTTAERDGAPKAPKGLACGEFASFCTKRQSFSLWQSRGRNEGRRDYSEVDQEDRQGDGRRPMGRIRHSEDADGLNACGDVRGEAVRDAFHSEKGRREDCKTGEEGERLGRGRGRQRR